MATLILLLTLGVANLAPLLPPVITDAPCDLNACRIVVAQALSAEVQS